MPSDPYVGEELELFGHATNWKSYWGSELRDYLTGDVLEVGAGMGSNVPTVLEHAADLRSLTCLEPDRSLAELVDSGDDRVGVRQGDTRSLDAAERFDAIMYIDVLEHIEGDRAELEIALRHLRPGGHLIVLVPAYQSLFTAFDAAIGHYRRYDRGTLSAVVPDGMRRCRLGYLDAAGLIASLANKALLRQAYPTLRQVLFWDRVLLPFSRVVDPLIGHRAGKSLVGVWQRALADG